MYLQIVKATMHTVKYILVLLSNTQNYMAIWEDFALSHPPPPLPFVVVEVIWLVVGDCVTVWPDLVRWLLPVARKEA
jgi:hypothetical protein